jgi:hypothetical protein
MGLGTSNLSHLLAGHQSIAEGNVQSPRSVQSPYTKSPSYVQQTVAVSSLSTARQLASSSIEGPGAMSVFLYL